MTITPEERERALAVVSEIGPSGLPEEVLIEIVADLQRKFAR